MQKYVEWYPWFAWLCVLGERKSNGQVAKIDEKNVKFLFLLEVLKMIFSSKVNACQLMACKCLYFFLLPLGFPGGNQVDGSPPAAKSNLQPAVDRQPGHRRGDREKVGTPRNRKFATSELCEKTRLIRIAIKNILEILKKILYFLRRGW